MDQKYEGYYTDINTRLITMDTNMQNMGARIEGLDQSINTKIDGVMLEFNNFRMDYTRDMSTLGHNMTRMNQTIENMFSYMKMVRHLYAFNCRVGNI